MVKTLQITFSSVSEENSLHTARSLQKLFVFILGNENVVEFEK